MIKKSAVLATIAWAKTHCWPSKQHLPQLIAMAFFLHYRVENSGSIAVTNFSMQNEKHAKSTILLTFSYVIIFSLFYLPLEKELINFVALAAQEIFEMAAAPEKTRLSKPWF